jgi:hypothetical protein
MVEFALSKIKKRFSECSTMFAQLIITNGILVLFGLILADIEEYSNDHEINFVWYTVFISILFVFVYLSVHALADCIKGPLNAFLQNYLKDNVLSSSCLWIVGQFIIGYISVNAYWILFRGFLLSDIEGHGAERIAFESTLYYWVIFIYITSFLFNYENFFEKLIKAIKELLSLPKRVLK